MCLKLHPPHLLYVMQSASFLCSDFSIISIILPKAYDERTFTIKIFTFSPFIALGIKIVKSSILAIPSPSYPLSIIFTTYSLFFSTIFYLTFLIFIISFTTSPAIINPATDGTNEILLIHIS